MQNKKTGFTLAEMLIAKRERGKMSLLNLSRTRELKAPSNRFLKQCAFTLAEVLITLGIIGVVAAMTIPTLVSSYQKSQTVSQLKKEYTTLAQAVKQSEIDNGKNSDWDWGTSGDAASIRTSFDTLWSPYLKVMKYCSSAADCGYTVGLLSGLLKDGVNQIGIYDPTTRISIMTPDGTFMMFHVSGKMVYVDLNAGKGPNLYGKDVFLFVLDPDKGLMPAGYSVVGNDCNSTHNGLYCAKKIMIDGWQISSDYPW